MIPVESIHRIADRIWSSVLGWEFRVLPAPAPDLPAPRLTAVVHITGAWEGAVTLDCGASTARRMAAAMTGADDAEEDDAGVDNAAVLDALGEIANMFGGNIAGLAPVPNQLSLPTVTWGTDYVTLHPTAEVVHRIIGVGCREVAGTPSESHVVIITLLARNAPPEAVSQGREA